jgi:hypothetical protein
MITLAKLFPTKYLTTLAMSLYFQKLLFLMATLRHHYGATDRGLLENVHNNDMMRPSDGGATYEYVLYEL